MRILILSQWFDPEPNFKGLAFARKLASYGHTVEVLTGFPNYPGGKLYPGYNLRPWKIEWMDGIRVCRVPLYPSHDRSAVHRILNYFSFAVASAVLGPALVHRPDVIYVYHPPGTIGLPALVLRHWFSAPIVYDVQDLWPDTIVATGMLSNRHAIGLLDRLCRFVYRQADRIVVLSPGFRSALIARGVPASKIDMIYNWCDEAGIEPSGAPPISIGAPKDFTVLFAGTMGIAQGLDAVLEAARLCRETIPQARFVFIGGGIERDRLERKANDMRLDNVGFLPRQPMAAMGPILGLANVLLVHLKNDPLFRITIPGKTQAYLAAGRPILMGVNGDAADLMNRSGAGLLCDADNPSSIAEGVRRLFEAGPDQLEAMGCAGRAFYKRELSMAVGVAKFEALFQQVCAARGRGKADNASSTVDVGLSLKRLLDIAGAASALLFLSPVLAAVAIAVRLVLGGPVLFRQTRPGHLANPFIIYKFRTMSEAADSQGIPLSDGVRLHPFGAFLRRTSLDELPEFWNVLRGDMSLVGPRPLLMKYLPFYTEEERIRFTVRPGVTGLAQVKGRNQASWNARLRHDAAYVRNRSLLLDFKILWMTLAKVVKCEHVIVDPRSAMLDLDEERAAGTMFHSGM